MKILFVGLIGLLLISNSFAEQRPILDFLKRENYKNFQLSPDGNRYAALLERNEKVMLVIYERSGKVTGGVNSGIDNEVHSFRWVNNTRITYQFANKTHYLDAPIPTGELYAIDYNNNNMQQLFGYQAGDAKTGSRLFNKVDSKASHEVISLLEDDDKNILIAEYPWSKQGRYYYDNRSKDPIISKLNVYTGARKKVELIPFKGAQILATPKGDINFVYWITKDAYLRGAYRENAKQPWTDISDAFDIGPDAIPVAVNDEGTHVYVLAYSGPAGIETFFDIDLKTKKISPLLKTNSVDIEQWFLNFDDNSPAVGVSYPNKVEYHYPLVETKTSKWHKMLAKAFKGNQVDLLNWTKDGTEIMAYVSSDVNAGEYYIFNTQTKKVKFLNANLSWLDPRQMRPKMPLDIVSRDNKKIPAFLTLPEQKLAPLVVLVHGGPHSNDKWGFDEEVQMLSNRGYAVLQVNFRGSTGFGKAYREAGYKEWGGKMIDDIIDATQSVIKQGLVDGKNVCIYGASYGGYAAMMSAAKEPDLFKCTIGYAGVYDLAYLYSKGDIIKNWGGSAYLKRTVGDDPAQLKAFSPIHHADKITANVMLIHGDKDIRAPIDHAKAMRDALKKAGKDVQWQYFGSAGHGVWNLDDQVELYTGLISFLDKNLKKDNI